jgi:hypothetical protein
MTGVKVDHPDLWIGVPHAWPFRTIADPAEWSTAVVDELAHATAEEPTAEQRVRIAEGLRLIAEDMPKRNAINSYIGIVSWQGPFFIADLQLQSADDDTDVTLEQFVGSQDPRTERPPTVEPFETTSGLTGLKCRRYYVEGPSSTLVVRVDYAWRIAGGFVRLYMVEDDLVLFERIAADLDALAASVSEA